MKKKLKLYHCTPIAFLEKILKRGLDHKKSKSSLQAVFLASSIDIAKEYAFMHKEYSDFVILEIELKKLNSENLGPDNYELQDFLESGRKNMSIGLTPIGNIV